MTTNSRDEMSSIIQVILQLFFFLSFLLKFLIESTNKNQQARLLSIFYCSIKPFNIRIWYGTDIFLERNLNACPKNKTL